MRRLQNSLLMAQTYTELFLISLRLIGYDVIYVIFIAETAGLNDANMC